MYGRKILLIFCFISGISTLFAYKHVILMHGLLSEPAEFNVLLSFINKTHPGTNVTVIDAFDNTESLTWMWKQTTVVSEMMEKVMKKHPEGVHLLCFSQGGLLCRGILETLDNHTVHNFISLSAPQGGQFGDTSFLKHFFPYYLKENMYKFFYTTPGQLFSVGNYWNDPHHQKKYLQYSAYLAVINNQSSNPRSIEYKENFLKLKNLILVGGPNDGVITPWQSSQFAAYDQKEKVVKMRKQEWYIKDWFGLQTLDKRKALHTYTIPHVEHHHFPRNFSVYKTCIEPWLT